MVISKPMPLPIQCRACNALYYPPVALAPGASVTMAGSRMSCPACRTVNPIPDGVFGYVEGVFQKLADLSPDVLIRIDEALRLARAEKKSAEEIVRAIGEKVPEARKFLPTNAVELAPYLAVLVALLAALLQYRSSTKETARPEERAQIIINQTVNIIQQSTFSEKNVLEQSSNNPTGKAP